MTNDRISVERIWAWSFDQVEDEEVKYYLLSHYIRELRFFDKTSAEELSIWINLTKLRETEFGNQLTIFDNEE